MNRRNGINQMSRHIALIALLLTMTIWLAGCASSSRTHRTGKLGQVPCPCEKTNR